MERRDRRRPKLLVVDGAGHGLPRREVLKLADVRILCYYADEAVVHPHHQVE